MSDVSVKDFADSVGTPVERLLTQLSEAGLPHAGAEETISDDDKTRLLEFLRASHGKASTEAPAARPRKKLTIRSKSEIKAPPSAGTGRRKSVQIEVRKKRTLALKDAPPQPEPTTEAPASDSDRMDEVKRDLTEEAKRRRVELDERLRVDQEQRSRDAAQRKVDAQETRRREKETQEEQRLAAESAVGSEPVTEASEPTEPTAALGEATPTATIESGEPSEPASEPAIEPAIEPAKAAEPAVAAAPAVPAPEPDREDKSGARKGRAAKRGKRGRDDGPGARPGGPSRPDIQVRASKGARRKKKVPPRTASSQHAFEKPSAPIVREVALPETLTVGELAQKMSVKAPEVIKALINMGMMVTINQPIDQDTASLVVEEMGHVPRPINENALEESVIEASSAEEGESEARAPVVTIMGHVDHGKTSLLDYIRRSKVAAGEAGGITQHIGAYHVDTDNGSITFLDTPGHAAFTAMRARGSKATDLVVLVVAADDGVMPQTEEAVQHAKAAGVPLIVAVNKIDREDANPDRVMQALSNLEVIPEQWGGDTQFIPVSAITGQGVDQLLEAIALQAEILELKAPSEGPASGVVIESRLDRGRGPVASVLVQRGTLHRGDMLLAGQEFGRVRSLIDDKGNQVESAGPATPVEVLGLSGVPISGDEVLAVADERKAREIAEMRQTRTREQKLARQQAANLENLFSQMNRGDVVTLNLVLKADVQGSVEALGDALVNISAEDAKVNIVASGTGGISETDVNLAIAANAILIGFNVRADTAARRLIEQEGVGLQYFSVIYDVIDTVTQSLTGMLKPLVKEEIVGIAEVRDVFRVRKLGAVAGCMVVEGTVKRSNPIRVLRDQKVIYEGELESLKRFKEDTNEVKNGIECGIGVRNYNDVKVGDQIEVYERVTVERTL